MMGFFFPGRNVEEEEVGDEEDKSKLVTTGKFMGPSLIPPPLPLHPQQNLKVVLICIFNHAFHLLQYCPVGVLGIL